MGLSLQPARLKRYAEIARLLYKYGRRDLVTRAGLEESLSGGDPPEPGEAGDPKDLADDLEKLGPAFVKLGQLLSTRPDILPPAYLAALERLQDNVEPFSFADVERVIQEEFGMRISKGFGAFDAEPIAAASLGQVHRAKLRDGRDIAVKIQRPDIRERMAAKVDVKEKDDRIVLDLKHSLDKDLYNYPLTLKTYVPEDWKNVTITQGNNTLDLRSAKDEKGSYIMYQAMPNAEEIIIKGA